MPADTMKAVTAFTYERAALKVNFLEGDNMSKKVISALLAALILASSAALGGCGKTDTPVSDDKSTTTAGADEQITTVSADTGADKDQAIIDSYELPQFDYNGYEFRIMARKTGDEWDTRDVYVPDETGEPLPDAVYRRRVNIEDKYNVKIIQVDARVDEFYSKISKSVNAGDDAYDALFINLETASKCTKSGQTLNLRDFQYIDLTKPWWDQSIMEDTSIMNKTYYAAGDISIMDDDGTWTMMFNKNMIRDFGLEDPYTLVNEGKWTIDKVQEMMKGVTKDLNGDGVIDHVDQVGWATTENTIKGLFYSFGLNILTKNDQDLPEYTLPNDIAAIDKLNKIFDVLRPQDGSTMYAPDYVSVNAKTNEVVQAAFEENRALFYAEVMQCVERIRRMETPFGIVPLPKWDENQPKYHTFVHEWASTVLAVPATVTDLDRTGIIIESLAHEGRKYITPAYKEIALKGKYARDNESSAMIDLIFEGRSADIGLIDIVGNIHPDLFSRFASKKTDFASWLDSKTDKINTEVGKIVTAYEGLE